MNAIVPTGRTYRLLALLAIFAVDGNLLRPVYAQTLPYPTTAVSASPSVSESSARAPVAEESHEAYGELLAPESGVAAASAESVVTPDAVPVAAFPTTDVEPEPEPEIVAAAEPEAVVHWYQPTYWFGPSPWDSGFELGLNGAGGTSESISFRTGGFIKREGDDYKFDSSLYYNKTESEGVEVQSNALLDVRYDWLFDDSPWTLFVMSQTFYDEFQAFDINFNANSGVGYRWLDKDWTKLTTSVGTGSSREFGGARDDWVAEASFGVNYELQFTETKKFYSKVDYFPEWEDFNRYRVLADIGLEIELHQPSNVSLKISATDRYDSHPEGVEPHNLNYSALLIWKL